MNKTNDRKKVIYSILIIIGIAIYVWGSIEILGGEKAVILTLLLLLPGTALAIESFKRMENKKTRGS